ncbi:MAG TPA: Lsr2 family protein [Pseudonocardiaceae bacterium]|nr:Lsr2 family protein [Pseudonocardiaceae bacterium]
MAQKTIVTLVDDLTGEEAENISTVEFALDGVTYELDLTDENSAKLHDALSQYAKAGRKIGGRRRGGPRPDRATKSTDRTAGYNRETLKSIRAWAKKNGHNVSDRGRLPAEVMQAWQTAQAAMSKA